MTRRIFLATGAAAAAAPLLLRIPSTGAAPDAMTDFGFPPPNRGGHYVKNIVFPVAGTVWWSDTYLACRDAGCSRHHEGQDLFGKKHQKLVAAVSGTIVVLRHRSTGNSLYIRSDADGWYYGYLHINNDSPGTDNNRNLYSQAFAPNVRLGSHVRRGQHIAYLGDSGNAESTSAHCHFEIRKPASSVWHSQAVEREVQPERGEGPEERLDRRPCAVRPASDANRRRGEQGCCVATRAERRSGSAPVRDGQFGPATEAAVKKLQKWYRLTPDGVYGRKSQWVLHVACDGGAHR